MRSLRWPWRVREPLRRLYGSDMPAAVEFLDRAPVDSVLVRDAVDSVGLGSSRAIGMYEPSGTRLTALAWDSGNLIPLGFDEAGLDTLAESVLSRRRIASSLVGPQDQVLGLWGRLEPAWGAPREVRETQYSLATRVDSPVRPDPLLRRALPEEHAMVLPAAVAMFKEEVGYDPTAPGNYYSRRVAELIREGRTFIRTEGEGEAERVVFKADIGALGGGVAQVQGVWTAPDRRGRGLATAGMAAVVRILLREVAPTVSLYVNDYNQGAVRLYGRVGFDRVGTWSTVLL